jgi:hypothetical protein
MRICQPNHHAKFWHYWDDLAMMRQITERNLGIKQMIGMGIIELIDKVPEIGNFI